jgi:hypothetical protein
MVVPLLGGPQPVVLAPQVWSRVARMSVATCGAVADIPDIASLIPGYKLKMRCGVNLI